MPCRHGTGRVILPLRGAERGFASNIFCIGTDMSILYQWFKENGKGMRDLLGSAELGAPSRAEAREEGTAYRG
jgi:hypothetical protein